MLRTNKTRHMEWQEMCKCEFSFGANICNNIQLWNKDKCKCECKELIDKDLVGILVIVSVNVIKRVILVNI